MDIFFDSSHNHVLSYDLDDYLEIPPSCSHSAFEGAMKRCVERCLSTSKSETTTYESMTAYQKTQLGNMCKRMVKSGYTRKTFTYSRAGVTENGYLLLKIYPKDSDGSTFFDANIFLS